MSKSVEVILPVTTYTSLLEVITILLAAIVPLPARVSIVWFEDPLKPDPLFTLALLWLVIASSNGNVIDKVTLLALFTILLATVSLTVDIKSLTASIPAISA